MDRLESLGNALSQITMYDIKTVYNQAKNVVLNISEMEAKVREATNDEPWGASSTLMQEIAQGTFNFQNFNEIMPCIYARFMEKEAKQWRQIYKALQLLEYLIKNGSERVVDDARSHIATIKMLRNFYYVDEKGKDQGINVRNRSRELTDLLGDVEKIRSERRKAKANRNKYIGTGNDAMSFSSGGSRYGGFGSDSLGYGGSSGGNYSGDYGGSYSGGGGSSGSGGSGFRDDSPTPRRFQEYDAGDDDHAPSRSNSLRVGGNDNSRAPRRASTLPSSTLTPPKQKEPVQELDLLGMDDDAFASPAAPAVGSNKALPVVAPTTTSVADDDFDDFIAAPLSAGPTTNQFAAPAAPPVLTPSLQQTLQPTKSFSPPPVQPQAPVQQPGRDLFTMLQPTSTAARTPLTSPTSAGSIFSSQASIMPSPLSPASRTTPSSAAPQKASANFDDLWSMSLGSKPAAATPAAGPAKSIKDLEKEKAAGIWGQAQSKAPLSPGFGSFAGPAAGSAAPPPSSSGGIDDLLF